MNKKYFMALADYNSWADDKAMDWLAHISDVQWKQVSTSSFNSIEQTAVHIASAEKVWIDFWNNSPDPVYLSVIFQGTKNDLIEIWKKASLGVRNFMESHSEEMYRHQVNFSYPRGGKGNMEFWQTFAHIVNHSTYHRGQLVTLLRQAGFTKFSSIDLASYYITHRQ